MKIRIVKASEPTFWYADKVGEVFEVTGDAYGDYFVNYGGRSFKYIVDTVDCEEVNKTEAVGMKTVKRKANVGERILITKAVTISKAYTEGDVFNVKEQLGHGVRVAEHNVFIYHEEYEVITENPKGAVGMANGIIEQMQAEIETLKTKVAALEGGKTVDFGEVHGQFGIPRLIKFAKSPQDIRDDIVAKAKRDVEDLKSEWNVRDDIPGGKLRYIRGQYVCNEEFIVNQEKRTVVCLLRWKYDNSLVSKGIAKCDPSDCFNASLGRAISLRRALGLEVPAEYFTAPAPTEVRVGDVIALHNIDITHKVSSAGLVQAVNGQIREGIASIIDDSREGASE